MHNGKPCSYGKSSGKKIKPAKKSTPKPTKRRGRGY